MQPWMLPVDAWRFGDTLPHHGLLIASSIFIAAYPDTSNLPCTWYNLISAQIPKCLLNKCLPDVTVYSRVMFSFAE
jgi:hypothetical protein